MRKYLYKLHGKENEYTSNEIARELELDENFLEEALEDKNYDISLACMATYNEKVRKIAIISLLDLYPTNYICSNNINDLINNQMNIKNSKRRFLNTLDFITMNNDAKYVIFNKRSINTLLVNTEDDVKKKVMDEEGVATFKALKSLIDGIDDNYFSHYLNQKTILHSVSKDYYNNRDSVSLTVEDTKKVLEYLSEYKLPSKFNVLVTEELVADMNNTNNMSCNYTYTRKN